MNSTVYVRRILQRLSPMARRVVSVEFASPSGRSAIVQALSSPFPEEAIAQIVANRIADRMRQDTGLGIQVLTSKQFSTIKKAETADELAALKAAKRDKSEIAAAQQALKAAKRDKSEIAAAQQALKAAKKSKDKAAIAAAQQALKSEQEERKAEIAAAQQAYKSEQVERKEEITTAQQNYKTAVKQYANVKLAKDERKAITAEIGTAGEGYEWLYKRDPKTGELMAVRHKKHKSGNFFDKIGRTLKPFVPIIIGVVGAVLAPFTGGASLVAAAVISAGYQINQKRIQSNHMERTNKKAAKEMKAQVAVETKQLNSQLDDLYKKHPEIFAAAGISASRWASMSVDEKLAVVERINSGKMPSTPENVIAASEAQGVPPPASLPDQPVVSTIAESPFMQPENSVDSTPAASGGGGLMVLAAGAAIAGTVLLSDHK